MQRLNSLFRYFIGFGIAACAAFVGTIAGLGVAAGILFPEYENSAFLQFPVAGSNVIDAATFTRIAASYKSSDGVKKYLESIGQEKNEAAGVFIEQSRRPDFFDRAAVPILQTPQQPVQRTSKEDSALLGARLALVTRSESVATDAIMLWADYLKNAIIRERIRDWLVAGKVEALSSENQSRAKLIRSELDITLLTQRASDLTAILAKYPDAARLDTRQMVNLSETDASERFQSPLTQVVSFESLISQHRDMIRRIERSLRQTELKTRYYVEAEKIYNDTVPVDKLLKALNDLAQRTFADADTTQEWVKELTYLIYGSLDNFSAMQDQLRMRTGSIRMDRSRQSSPIRLALIGGGLALAFIVLVALIRISVLALHPDDANA